MSGVFSPDQSRRISATDDRSLAERHGLTEFDEDAQQYVAPAPERDDDAAATYAAEGDDDADDEGDDDADDEGDDDADDEGDDDADGADVPDNGADNADNDVTSEDAPNVDRGAAADELTVERRDSTDDEQ